MSKVFMVTGASRGLGRAVAETAVHAGHSVVATARRPEQLADLADAHPEQVLTAALDVTDAAAAEAAVAAALDRFGRIDVLVNNAGYANLAAFEDVTLEDFRAQLDTNLFGVVTVAKAVLPHLRAQGSGRIVNVSSIGGRIGTPGLSAYQAAKWAVGGLSEVMAAELAPLGVRVTVIEPGGMTTDWAGSSMQIAPVSPAYDGTVGVLARLFTSGGVVPAGDPTKVADVIVRLTDEPEPPLRLVLGSDALVAADQAATARAAEDAAWRDWSTTTDRDDATSEELDPLAQAT